MTRYEPFSVWAPRADNAELVLGADTVALEPAGDGWFVAPADTVAQASAAGDVDYGYLLDGEGPFPDPRSRRQPKGVHELSRTWDASAYAWGDRAWSGRPLAGGVIYELHIGTFTPGGTFDSAIEKLDHLVELGIDFVEVLPVNGFNGLYNWGYDGVLWYAVHEQYGGPTGYQRFVDACHQRGLAVIQDVVYNHLGPSGNYLPKFGPYLHDGSSNTWGASLNLDGEESDAVRDYIVDNVLSWFTDMHVDGLRLDAVHALRDDRATHILQEMAIQTERVSARLNKPLTLIAESDRNDPRTITPLEAGGIGMAGQWSDDFHHAVHANVTGEHDGYYADFAGIESLVKVLTRGFFHDGTYSSFRGHHHGAPIDTLRTPAWRLVVCNQNHDQIGNRAIGDRLTATLDENQLALAAGLTLLSPFTPMLFMGEEWAASTPWQFFTSHPEPELGTATAEGRIAEFAKLGWDPSIVPDPQDPETFERSKLQWGEIEGDGIHGRTLELYRRLIHLRRSIPSITDPSFRDVTVHAPAETLLVIERPDVAILVNLAADTVELPDALAARLTGWSEALVSGDYTATPTLGAHTLVVLTREPLAAWA